MFDLSRPILIGMVHLPPLPGSPRVSWSLERIVQWAVNDARALADAGFGAAIIENFGDAPFAAEHVEPVTVASMAVVASEVRRAVTIPVGVNVLRNDGLAALAVAATSGATFIRVNVLVGLAATDQGLLTGCAYELLRERKHLAADVAILADVHVKHAVPLHQPDIAVAAEETAYRGLADALIVSGSTTGRPADPNHVQWVKSAVPDRPLLVGSGVTHQTVAALLRVADGVIVGTSIKEKGKVEAPVDPQRAAELVRAARS